MKEDAGQERRRHERLPAAGSIVGRELSQLGLVETKKPVRGSIEDVSRSGLCIQTSRPLTVSFPVLCEVPFAHAPVGVPILMKVQWTRQVASRGNRYRSGLQFLV